MFYQNLHETVEHKNGTCLARFDTLLGPAIREDRIVTGFEIVCQPEIEKWSTPGIEPKFWCLFFVKDRHKPVYPSYWCEVTSDGIMFDETILEHKHLMIMENLCEVKRLCTSFLDDFLNKE